MRRCDSGLEGPARYAWVRCRGVAKRSEAWEKDALGGEGVRNARKGQDAVCDRGTIASIVRRFEGAMRALLTMRAGEISSCRKNS
jgi:hypothetical protein